MSRSPEIPKTIGRYEILSLVGRGGMGVLYRARDPRLERDVALKMMLVDFRADPAARERFQREARAVARLQHRNVVTIHELGEVDATPYIVMEMLGGSDLDALLRRGEPAAATAKLDIGIQLCEGLAYAHSQGIVHRDIKPNNVRVLDDGSVKILDFGIARFVNNTLTQSGTIMGTPSYMAPEQILGQPLDGRADLFAAGVLLYELLAGRKPFAGDSPTAVAYQIVNADPPPLLSVAPGLPDALGHVVAHALRKRPEDRYQHAAELAADLRTVRATLDPLLSGALASADARTGAVRITLGPLHAPAAVGADDPTVLDVKIRDTQDKPVEARRSRGGWKLGVAAAAIVVVATGGYLGWRAVRDAPPSGADLRTSGPPDAGTSGTPDSRTPGPSMLAVVSVPPGARIRVNGVDHSRVTPAVLSLTGPLPQQIELSLDGYQPASASITADDLKAGTREFTLVPDVRPVALTVAWTHPFELVQGNRVLSTEATRHQLTVPPGEPVIARSAALLLNQPLSIDFRRRRAAVAIPPPGALAIFATIETCQVTVDRQSLGFPPIARKVVAAGAHTVVLTCPDGRQETRRVTVVSGIDEQVKFSLPR